MVTSTSHHRWALRTQPVHTGGLSSNFSASQFLCWPRRVLSGPHLLLQAVTSRFPQLFVCPALPGGICRPAVMTGFPMVEVVLCCHPYVHPSLPFLLLHPSGWLDPPGLSRAPYPPCLGVALTHLHTLGLGLLCASFPLGF